jgi:hypothetical protein
MYPVPQPINGFVEPGKKNPTIFFFAIWSDLDVIKPLLVEDLLPLCSF